MSVQMIVTQISPSRPVSIIVRIAELNLIMALGTKRRRRHFAAEPHAKRRREPVVVGRERPVTDCQQQRVQHVTGHGQKAPAQERQHALFAGTAIDEPYFKYPRPAPIEVESLGVLRDNEELAHHSVRGSEFGGLSVRNILSLILEF